VWAKTILMS